MIKRTFRLFLTLVMLGAAALVGGVATAGTAHADACYTWSGTLSVGSSGSAVTQLQIRVAGYPGTGNVLAIDGRYGEATKAAVARFQSAYGLSSDGIAGQQTFNQIYALQDADCSPVNFTFAELNKCNSTYGGGAVSAATAKENAKRTMWKLQAMRKAMGSAPITVSSGFRSVSCNNAVGGSPTSRHLYGDAADLVGSHSLCSLAQRARNHGFREILGPGYPGHSDHTHVAHKSTRTWSAPNCGV